MNLYDLRQQPHLSASSIGDYLDCGMLYKFGRVDRLPREYVADALEFGSVIHAVLAEYYQAKMTGDRMLLKDIHDLFKDLWHQTAYGRDDIEYAVGKDFDTLMINGIDLLTAWYSSKHYVQSWEYIDELGYKLVDDSGKLILVKKIEFTFQNFINWASEKFQEPKGISSLGGKTIFIVTMIFDGGQFLKIDYGKKSKTGFMPRDHLKVIWDRYINLKNRKHVTGEYTDPRFRETPNRILAPYVAAVIREFEVECSPNAWD